MSSESIPSKEKFLHKKFRNIISLLRLLRVLDEETSYPSLPADPFSNPPPIEKLPTRNGVIDAVTSILVMEHEVLAAAAYSTVGGETVSGGLVCTVPVMGAFDRDQMVIEPTLQSEIEVDIPLENRDLQMLNDAAVASPLNEQQEHTLISMNNTGLVLLPRGSSDTWSKIKEGGDLEGLIRGPPNLQDHAETIRLYLLDYRNPISRPKIEPVFFNYLISRCWRKMYRRIIHWSSLGFICRLQAISEETLRDVAANEGLVRNSIQPDDPRDEGLLKHLRILNELNWVIIFDRPFDRTPVLTPPLLVPDVSRLLNNAATSTCEGLYCKESVVDFHRLLVGLLIRFGCALAHLAKVDGWHRKDRMDDQPLTGDILRAVKLFNPIARTLYIVAHSGALLQHLRLLNSSKAELRMPMAGDRVKYRQFGIEYGIMPNKWRVEENNNVGDVNREAIDCPSMVNVNDMNDDVEENEDGEEYNEVARSTNNPKGDAQVFRRWIMTFVSHFSAKRLLEKHVARLPSELNIDIRLISAQRKKMISGSWDDMTTLIYSVVGDEKLAQRCIEVLAGRIDAYDRPNPHDREPRDHVLWSFAKLRRLNNDKDLIFRGGLHCEAILASLIVFYEKAIESTPENKELLNICKGLDGREVSVSRLCCPVCWDLLIYLRGIWIPAGDRLAVRGRHSTICEVELPHWLPLKETEPMVERFQGLLSIELRKMFQRSMPSSSAVHKRTPSLQSGSAVTSRSYNNINSSTILESWAAFDMLSGQ